LTAFAIRAARRDECDAVLQLWQRAGTLPTVSDDAHSLLRVIDATHATLLLAHDDAGALAGTVIAGWDGWRGTLYRLAVAPEHRRRGLARLLVEAAVGWHRQRGAPRVVLYTHRSEAPAIAFWRSLSAIGFTEIEDDVRFVLNF
jgi:ribosomal protein S18 acetylase RimI-like enzyme